MIDKLYIIRPSFSNEINWDAARKDWEKDHTTIFDNKAVWDEIHQYPEIHRVIEERIDEAYKEWAQFNEKGSEEDFLEYKYKKTFNDKGKHFQRKDWLTPEELTAVFQKAIEVSQDNYVIKAAKTELEFNDWIKENREKYLREVRSNHGVKGNNNIIFDTIWSVLTSAEAADLIFVPGNFDAPKKWGYMVAVAEANKDLSWELIEEIYNKAEQKEPGSGTNALKNMMHKGANLGFVQTHLLFHLLNMVAGKLIGIFALNNVSHCIISMEEDAAIAVPADITLEIEGRPVSKNGVASYDSLYGRDGKKISSTLAELLAASADAVKDPVLNYLNINLDTANVLCTLIRLGYGLELSAQFLTQPIIKKIVADAHAQDISVRKAASNMLKTYGANASDIPSISIEYLQGLRNSEWSAWDDVNLISAFLQLSDLALATLDILALTRFNSVSAAVGPQIADTRQLKNKATDALYSEFLNTPSMKRAINHPIIKAFRETSLALADTVFLNILVQASPTLEILTNELDAVAPFMKLEAKGKLFKSFQTFYTAWLLKQNGDTAIFKSSSNPYAGSVNRTFAILRDLDAIVARAKQNHPDNVFIKTLQLKPRGEGLLFNLIIINTKGMKSEDLDTMAMAWASLLEEDADSRALALGLAEYEFLKGGLSFRPGGLTEVLPIKLKRQIPNYVSTLLDTSGAVADKEELLTLFLRNYWNTPGLIPIASADKVQTSNNEGIPNTLYTREYTDPIIRFGNTLYVKMESTAAYLRYQRTTPLGGNSEFLEIYPDLKNPKSIASDIFYAERMKSEREDDSTVGMNVLKSDIVAQDMTARLVSALLINTRKEDIKDTLKTFRSVNTVEDFEKVAKSMQVEILLGVYATLNNITIGTVSARLQSLLNTKDLEAIQKILLDAEITREKLNLCGKL